LGLVVLIEWVSLRATAGLVESSEAVAAGQRILLGLEGVVVRAQDAQRGARGYVLTGDERFLEPYNLALDQLPQELDDLRRLTAQRPGSPGQVAELTRLVNLALGEFGDIVAARRTEGFAAARKLVLAGEGRKAMNDLRRLATQMQGQVRASLEVQEGAAKAAAARVPRVTLVGTAVSFGLLLAVFALLNREIAQRRAAEQELSRSNADLEQFAYVASHDLQEPLRMVASYTQLLARRYADRLDTDAHDFIRFAADGATRMQTLINDLLAYSRVGTRGEPLQPVESDAVCAQAIANLEKAIEESGAVVTRAPLPRVLADASQLRQLFQNLISNALKFRGPERPRVEIAASRNGSEWRFSVCDNGIGIDSEHAQRIFVLFQRLHNRAEYPGTGIGLAICKKIVERHGGRIWVESESGKGATFWVALPTANL
jgi:signal transduction histidine kinase